MQNSSRLSPPTTYLFPNPRSTPPNTSHAPYAHSSTVFSLGSPAHDHTAMNLHSYSVSSVGAASQYGWPCASTGMDPLSAYPAAAPGYQLKTLHRSTTWEATAPPPLPPPPPPPPPPVPHNAMAIAQLPGYSRSQPLAGSSSSGRSSRARDGGEDSGSDGREPTPPPAARQKAKDAKKKIHPCMMCHKSFDRPSTLKKHLLVHTGERAFACERCGRRFSVASNLNRHSRTCRAALATPAAASDSAPASVSSDSGSGTPTAPASSRLASSSQTASTARDANTTPSSLSSTSRKSDDGSEEGSPPESSSELPAHARSRKRARRAPTPERWIPDSLRVFDLTPLTKATPVPLPPVRPFQDSYNHVLEERDSFDENASTTPYHPRGWKGRLPGPGLTSQNVANRSGGQLLIF
ncbi:hypothetical protein C8Q80DRAFT_1265379 [Daedaleopsis nitida]|nr:hypothetical protein C8Q80DRAFT_1265379 [Daedaleopsis nitida]